MKYVFSTLTAANHYTVWEDGGADLKILQREIRIEGGAGLANKHFMTPRGVMTKVSDEDYELLQKDPCFAVHVKNGFITVADAPEDPEKVAADLGSRDGGAPDTPESLELEGLPVPKADAATAPAQTSPKPSRSRS